MVDYGQHTLRIPQSYDARLRRAFERFKMAIDTMQDDITTLEAATPSDMTALSITIDGNEASSVGNPSSNGEQLFVVINKVTSAGAYSITADFYNPAVGARSSASASLEGASLYCIANTINDVLCWVVILNSGPSSNWTLAV